MKLYADDYFDIGKAHQNMGTPCQDYALSGGKPDEVVYTIVSDGCTKGGRTDVGSRIVSHATQVAIRDHWKRHRDANAENAAHEIDLHKQVILTNAKVNLGLSRDDLLATSLFAYVTPKGGFVHLRGDGVIAVVRRDGIVGMRKFEWGPKNLPLYPAYFEDNFAGFAAEHGGSDAQALTEHVATYEPGKGFREASIVKHSVATGIRGITTTIGPKALADIAFIALFTDGVTQIDGCDWKDAVVQLTTFVGVAGFFAKRRMISFIKEAQKKGKGPMDDIAYAVIRVDNEEEGNGS